MKKTAFIITVPRWNRKFRVFGYSPANAELAFSLTVTREVPEHVRSDAGLLGPTEIRFDHKDIAFGQLRVEADPTPNLIANEEIEELLP